MQWSSAKKRKKKKQREDVVQKGRPKLIYKAMGRLFSCEKSLGHPGKYPLLPALSGWLVSPGL